MMARLLVSFGFVAALAVAPSAPVGAATSKPPTPPSAQEALRGAANRDTPEGRALAVAPAGTVPFVCGWRDADFVGTRWCWAETYGAWHNLQSSANNQISSFACYYGASGDWAKGGGGSSSRYQFFDQWISWVGASWNDTFSSILIW